MTSSTENNNYSFDKNFKNYFNDEKFASFIEEFETNIINKSNPAMTFYKIIVLKKFNLNIF